MQILSRITLIAGVYHVQVGLNDDPAQAGLTPGETEAIAAFGEPSVECGGTFTQVSPSATFTLPADPHSLPSDFPVVQTFALADASDALIRAHLFQSTISTRMVAARDSVTTQSQGVTGTTVTTV